MQASIAKPRVPCHGQLPIHRQPRRLALHPFTVLLLVGLAGLLPPGAYPAAAAVNAKPRLKIPHVALAQVPWQRHFRHPTPLYIPLMSLPWADCHVLTLHLPHSPVKPWVDPDSHFIMAMCTDLQGNLWLATEGAGVYRYDPSAPQARRWTQFTKQNTHGTLANNCIYAIACDNRGRIWAGELNHGISVFNGRVWQDYDIVQNPKHHVLAGPLGNHVYAMAFDRYTDQMWIDTENGISIYQCGQSAPAVASRAIDPPGTAKLGDGAEPDTPVLQPPRHRWHYITQANGLPMNPDSMAFAPDGTVLVGTQCGGLTIGTPRQGNTSVPSDAWGWNHYRWETITGPWHMPLSATGKGLPGNLVNSVAVTWKNHLAVATDEGIALGKWVGVPQGAATVQSAIFSHRHRARASSPARAASSLRIKLVFEHGQNFVAKVHGLWHPPAHWRAPSGSVLAQLPTEDHTTVVAWQGDQAQGNKAGYLWLGHWRTGLDVWQYNASGSIIRRWHIGEPQVGNYIQSLLPLKGGSMAVGCYGDGVKIITLPGQSGVAWRQGASASERLRTADVPSANHTAWAKSNNKKAIIPTEPQGARPPSARQLTAMANAIREELIKSKGKKQPQIVPLPDDWRTEGNWLGRYGKYWIDLAAVCSPYDFVWGTEEARITYWPELAFPPPGDSARYWVQTLQTANPRALELPKPYMESREKLFHVPANLDRRDASTDDHGEVYPSWRQGPGVALLIRIPQGLFAVSLYEWNYNGHSGRMRQRDYTVSAMALPKGWNYFTAWRRGLWTHRDTAVLKCYGQRPGVVARADQNWGGEWVRFMVRGPVVMAVRFSRNYSLNTHVLGAAVDTLGQHPLAFFGPQAKRLLLARRESAGVLKRTTGAGTAADPPRLPCATLSRARASCRNALAFVTAARWLIADAQPPAGRTASGALRSEARCFYRLCLFRRWERLQRRLGLVTPRSALHQLRTEVDANRRTEIGPLVDGVLRRDLAARNHGPSLVPLRPNVGGARREHN